jgi:hypothetical protein
MRIIINGRVLMTDNDEVDTGSYVVPGSDWTEDENFWRTNYASRPYASSDQGFEVYRSAYRYGHDAARQHRGRRWSEVESELRSGWRAFEGRGERAWEQIKGAVHDAWDRVTGH